MPALSPIVFLRINLYGKIDFACFCVCLLYVILLIYMCGSNISFDCQNMMDKGLDKIVDDFFVGHNICLAGFDLKKPLQTFLTCRLKKNFDEHFKNWINGISAFKSSLNVITISELYEDILTDVYEHSWKKDLEPYRGCMLYYVFDESQFECFRKIHHDSDLPIILITDYEMPDNIMIDGNVSVMTMEFSEQLIFSDKSFELCFPLLFHYVNTFTILLMLLSPQVVICFSDCHYQEQVLSEISSTLKIKCHVE